MTKTCRTWLLACCLASMLPGRAPAAPVAPPPPAEIDRLVRQLGDAAFATREQATRRLTELGDDALPALRIAMKNGDPEIRRRAEAVYRQLTDLSPEQRAAVAAAAAKAFAEADYVTAARHQARLARLPRPTIAECVAVGHDWQMAEKWADAAAGYLRAVERIDEVLAGDPEIDPPPMAVVPPNGPWNGRGPIGPSGLADHQRRDLVRQRGGLFLLAGRLQRDQAGDPAAAAVMFARIIDLVPEFQGELPALLSSLAAYTDPRRDQMIPTDVGRGLQLLNEFLIMEELARTQEQLKRIDDAILTLARLNTTRIRTRPDGFDESVAELARLIRHSPAVRATPAGAALIKLVPPVGKPVRPSASRPDRLDGSPFEWVATNLGDSHLGPMNVRDLARLPDGRWVAAITAGSRVHVATTRDLTTWDAPRMLPASIVGNNIDPAITVDDRGEVWLAWFSNRLSLEPTSSGGYTLWLAHSADLKTWSPPRAINAETNGGWPMGTMHWLHVGREFRLSWRTYCATAASPGDIRRLEPLAMPQDKQVWPLDPHVSKDATGRFHLVANNFSRGVVYSTSADGKTWSDLRPIVPAVHERSVGGEPHLQIDGDRVALIYQDVHGTSLRRGKLADIYSLAPPVAIGRVSGTRWHRVDDTVVGFAGGETPWLLRATVADLFRGR